jgi:hypothetical protein
LVKVSTPLVVTLAAQAAASLATFDNLTIDQLYLISRFQASFMLLQRIVELLVVRPPLIVNICLYATLAGLNSSAAGLLRHHKRQELVERCLEAFMPKLKGLPWAKIEVRNVQLGFILAATIAGMIAAWGVINSLIPALRRWHGLSRARPPKSINPHLYCWLRIVYMVGNLICCFVTVFFCLFFITLTYVASRRIKKSNADLDIRSFGQILALSAGAMSIWEFCKGCNSEYTQ